MSYRVSGCRIVFREPGCHFVFFKNGWCCKYDAKSSRFQAFSCDSLSNISWRHIWQGSDMEVTRCQGRGQKARRRLAIPRKLASTIWGASEQVLKTFYKATVRPHLDYSSTTWSTTAKTKQRGPDKVQNWALRLITGAMQSTPITEMNRLTGVQPLSQSRDAKILTQAGKFRWLPNHPVKSRVEGLTMNRLKKVVLCMIARSWPVGFKADCPRDHSSSSPPDMSEPWVTDITDIKVHTSLSDGDTQDDTVKQSLTLAMTAERYPQEAWIYVFNAGSATNAVTNGGAEILVHFPGGQKATASIAVGKHCANYHAETEALMQTASILEASDHDYKQVVFLSDALSIL